MTRPDRGAPLGRRRYGFGCAGRPAPVRADFRLFEAVLTFDWAPAAWAAWARGGPPAAPPRRACGRGRGRRREGLRVALGRAVVGAGRREQRVNRFLTGVVRLG